MTTSPETLSDGYKIDHIHQYQQNTELIVSNVTARGTRRPNLTDNKTVVFGLQYLIKKYLIEEWNENFFKQPLEKVLARFTRRINNYLGPNSVGFEHIENLHKLGYLPISIYALPEGSRVKLRTPSIVIFNTLPEFFWVTNYLETIISTSIWGPCTSATTAYEYKVLLKRYALETVGNADFVQWQGHDFSFRGMYGMEAACMSGAAHLTCFTGTDTIPAIDFLEAYYNADSDKELIGGSVAACYDDKTEILTNKGWKLFVDLDKSELVAQFNKDKSIEFIKPTEYFKDRYKGKMIQFSKTGHKYIDALVTPNHKMVRIKNNEIDLFEAGDFSYQNRNGYSHRNYLVVAGKSKIDGDDLTDLERLKIAFQADGSFPSHAENYTGEKGKGFPIRFSLKKERKKDRLISLCVSAGLNYKYDKYENGYYSFWINVPEKFNKDFSWVNLSTFSFQKAKDFIEELQYWDGNKPSGRNCICYSSVNKINIDILQGIAVLAEIKTQYNNYLDQRGDRQLIHNLTFQLNKTVISGESVNREEIEYDGYVYCVSVPSKMIVVRRNNVVLICGNTEHSVACSVILDFVNKLRIEKTANGENIVEDELMNLADVEYVKYLITEVYPTGIVSIVSDSFDYWNTITNTARALKDVILARNGKVVFRPDCYSEDTQIYTEYGWKYFKDLTEEDLVAQVLNDGSYEFIKPSKIVSYDYEGKMHHFKDSFGKIDLLVTPNHRMILQQKGVERIVFAENLGETGHWKQKMIRSAAAKSNKNKRLSNIERIKIAFQADGSYKTKCDGIRFTFAKKRKIDRLKNILDSEDTEYKMYLLNSGQAEFNIALSNKDFVKDFSWVDCKNLTKEWCQDFIEEMSYWDATRRSNDRFKFDTTNKDVIQIVERIAIGAGYGVLISEAEDSRKEFFSNVYTAHILKDNSIGGQSWENTIVDYKGKVRCVTVPSGRLLVKRNKSTLVCGNSGDPTKIVTGYTNEEIYTEGDKFYLPDYGCGFAQKGTEEITDAERKGSIECLWDIFGGTITDKGYKLLDEHVGLIYGDSITLDRAERICEGLKAKGFASTNIVFGIGSYTYQYVTRDTDGYAIKATFARIDGEDINIYKKPKTDTGTKNSAVGLVAVYKDENGDYYHKDRVTWDEFTNCELKRVFENSVLLQEQSLAEIRRRLEN